MYSDAIGSSYDLLSQTRTLQRHNLLIFPCCFETCPTTQPAFYIKITLCLSYFIRAHRIESSACQTIYTFWFRTLRSTSAPRTIPGCDIDCGKMDSDEKSSAFPFKTNVTITNFRHLWVDYEWAWAQHKDGKSNISSSNKRFFVCLSASSEDLTVEWNILLVNAIPSNPVQYCTYTGNECHTIWRAIWRSIASSYGRHFSGQQGINLIFDCRQTKCLGKERLTFCHLLNCQLTQTLHKNTILRAVYVKLSA